MKLRIRRFGALMALVALTAFFAEGVWAAACPPEMQLAGVAHVAEHDGADHLRLRLADPAVSAHAHGHGDADTGDAERSRSDRPTCPLGPLGANGSCVVAASLPATTTQMAPSFPGEALLSASPEAARDLLLATALFHPPRA
jgi:hypothetical protein